MPRLPTHSDADVACSLYVYSHCSCCEAIRVLMIVNELSCKSQWHRPDAWHLPLSNQTAAAQLVDLGHWRTSHADPQSVGTASARQC